MPVGKPGSHRLGRTGNARRELPGGVEEGCPGLRICVLGPLAVWRGDESITPRSTGERTILALLALAPGDEVPAGTIRDHVWPGQPPNGAAGVLHTHVSRLRDRLEPGRARRARGGILSSQHGAYRLCPPPGGLDLLVFRELASLAQAAGQAGQAAQACAAYEEALSLWRGDVVADVDIGGHPALTQLADERIAVTLEHAELAGACGRHRAALPHLRNAAALEPLHGAVHARLMLVLASLGQHAEALRVFDGVRTRLREELGTDPDPVLRDAHARVLAQNVPGCPDPPAAAVGPPRPTERAAAPAVARGTGVLAPHQLPARPPVLGGRATELDQAVALLTPAAAGPPAVVTVSGMPGVGKSALAVWAAHRVSAAFPSGELFADLGGTGPGASPVVVLRAFVQALDPGCAAGSLSEREAVGRYRSLAAGLRLLVVLDGAVCADQVRPLLPTGEGSAALITSRETLASLDTTGAISLAPLDGQGSRTALAELTGSSGVRLEPCQAALVAQTCDGLPLALRIATARLAARPSWPTATTVARLADERTRLAALRHGDLSVSASLRASYDALRLSASPVDLDAADALPRFGLLPCPEVYAAAAAAALGFSPARCERALDRLVDAHLLTCPAPSRYRMSTLLRLFCRELAETEPGLAGFEIPPDSYPPLPAAALRQRAANGQRSTNSQRAAAG